jgi:hypothetical protein
MDLSMYTLKTELDLNFTPSFTCEETQINGVTVTTPISADCGNGLLTCTGEC